MSKSVPWRRSWRAGLAALCGALALTAVAQAKSQAGTWNLANEFTLTKQNPAPDKYGHKAVWFYTYGEAGQLGKYKKLKYSFGPAEQKAACGVSDYYGWNKTDAVNGTPAIWYNAGPLVEEGHNSCAPFTTSPAQTVFMHPEAFGKDLDAVVGWRSPIKGAVTVSGSIQPVDRFVTGIAWQLDQGSTILAGPGEVFEDATTSFGPLEVPVAKGQYLYLEVGRPPTVSGAYDSTAVTLTITSP